MSGDAGGWMWLLIDVALVAVLAAALAYGIMVWRRRSPGLSGGASRRQTGCINARIRKAGSRPLLTGGTRTGRKVVGAQGFEPWTY